MAKTELAVLICGQLAGMLWQDEAGLFGFSYEPRYSGAPLSISMPVSNRSYGQDVVRPYLFGLLPDSERQRRALAKENGVSANNPVALLSCMGLDCPGAVQFCSPETLDGALNRKGTYRILNDKDIAARLKSIRTDFDATWAGRDESWSLGGNQGKFALAWENGSWCECGGSSPTTHIFKNGVVGFKFEALNEFVCMRTAAKVGIPTAQVDYRLFGDEPALIVSRYDRILTPSGVQRAHQEDLCQALGVMPEQKYTSDGGPTARDVLELLLATGKSSANLRLFTQMLFFNCLIGAPDAHAKNYSLLLSASGDALIAPMYDVASGLAYDRTRDLGKLAMSIGGENRVGRIGASAICRYVGQNAPELKERLEENGLSADVCIAEMGRLAKAVPTAMSEVLDDAERADLPGAAELGTRLLPNVEKNCAATSRLL